MEIKKEGAQSLGMKMRNAEWYSKGGAVIMIPNSRLEQDCPN